MKSQVTKEQIEAEMHARMAIPCFILIVNTNEYKIGVHGLIFRLTYDNEWRKSTYPRETFMKDLRRQCRDHLKQLEAYAWQKQKEADEVAAYLEYAA